MQENSNSGDSGKEPSSTANVSEAAEDLVPFRRKDAPEAAPQGDAASSPKKPDRKASSPRLKIFSFLLCYFSVAKITLSRVLVENSNNAIINVPVSLNMPIV